MGMNTDADEIVPIPSELLKELKQDMGPHRLEETLKAAGIHEPIFHVGENVDIRGVRFEVYEIERGGLSLRPIGWTKDQPGERTDQKATTSGLESGQNPHSSKWGPERT